MIVASYFFNEYSAVSPGLHDEKHVVLHFLNKHLFIGLKQQQKTSRSIKIGIIKNTKSA